MAERALSPADYAMTVVKGDDKVEKFVPLLIPAGFAAAGALQGAGFRFRDDEGNFNMNFGGNAKAVDPLTGGMIGEKDLGDSTRAKFLGAGVGALQGLNPLTYLRPLAYAGRGAKALRARRAANLVEAGDAAADTTRTVLEAQNRARALANAKRNEKMYRTIDAMDDGAYRFVGGGVDTSLPSHVDDALNYGVDASRALRASDASRIDYLADLARQDEIARLQGLGTTASGTTQPHLRAKYLAGEGTLAGVEGVGRAVEPLSRNPLGTSGHWNIPKHSARQGLLGLGGRSHRFDDLSRAQRNIVRAREGARVGQTSAVHGPAIAGGIAAYFGQQAMEQPGAAGNVDVAPVNQGASGSALGQGGMGNMAGARHGVNPEQQIWSGQLEAQRNQQQSQPIATGEYMTLGDRLLKEAQERMDKAHCGTMKADGCPGCPKCEGDNKKKAKKPAHGMVIVIGSKAGPGPSKDGKREKLDSDKDDKKE